MVECVICAYPFDSAERLRTYASCGHSDICSICFLRMRALMRSFVCPSCKVPLEHVVCSADPTKSFESFQIWGESCGPDFQYDPKSQMFFPKDYFRKKIEPLWSCKCKLCHQVKRDLKGLKIHVSADHNLQLCSLCLEHRHSFPAEHRYYTKSDYEKHLRTGDGDGSLGHPFCEFCRKRYFDRAALFVHLNKDHFSCHLCAKQGVQFKYYANYEVLEEHFGSDHFLCNDAGCLQRKFVVFSNAIDLQAHSLQWHPNLQVSRNIPVHFQVRRENEQLESGNRDKQRSSQGEEVKDSDYVKGRMDGGVGGSSLNGEWQVEFQNMPRDPRNGERSVGGGFIDLSLITAASGTGEPEEEFPSLPGERPSRGGLGWGVYGGAKAAKSARDRDFPTLSSSNTENLKADTSSLRAHGSRKKSTWASNNPVDTRSLSMATRLHMGESLEQIAASPAPSQPPPPPPPTRARPPPTGSKEQYPELLSETGKSRLAALRQDTSASASSASWGSAMTAAGMPVGKSKHKKKAGGGLTVVRSIAKSSSSSDIPEAEEAKMKAMQDLSLESLRPLQREDVNLFTDRKRGKDNSHVISTAEGKLFGAEDEKARPELDPEIHPPAAPPPPNSEDFFPSMKSDNPRRKGGSSTNGSISGNNRKGETPAKKPMGSMGWTKIGGASEQGQFEDQPSVDNQQPERPSEAEILKTIPEFSVADFPVLDSKSSKRRSGNSIKPAKTKDISKA